MVCLLCDFKILLTVFNQSYNCQTSHHLGRNRLPKPFLILPSLLLSYGAACSCEQPKKGFLSFYGKMDSLSWKVFLGMWPWNSSSTMPVQMNKVSNKLRPKTTTREAWAYTPARCLTRIDVLSKGVFLCSWNCV